MRVFVVSTMDGAPWGGSEELWSGAASVLLDRGCHVTVCLKGWPTEHPVPQSLRERGAIVRYRRGTLFAKIQDRLRNPIVSFLKRGKPKLVLISQGSNACGLLWMESCSRLGIEYVTIAQAVLPWQWPSDEDAARLRRAYLSARKTYFVSQENLSRTERQIGTSLDNSQVVRNPFKVPYDGPVPWPRGEGAQWACVARLDIYTKGLDILLDVLSRPKWRSRPLKVTIYGSGPHATMLREAVRRDDLKNIAFGGFVSRPLEIWREHHCLVLPSRGEGLPLAIVEAMLCGRPCIVTDVSGNAELLQKGVTGFIAEGPTSNAVDAAMEEAWGRRDDWHQMGRCAAASVRRYVPPRPAEVFANDLIELYNDV